MQQLEQYTIHLACDILQTQYGAASKDGGLWVGKGEDLYARALDRLFNDVQLLDLHLLNSLILFTTSSSRVLIIVEPA